MSISSEINRISGNVSDSLDAVAEKGVTVPAGSNSDDLPGLIRSIPSGGAGAISIVDTTDTAGGTIRTITAVDISNDTVTAQHLEVGYTAHDASGNAITGVLEPGSEIVITDEPNATGTTAVVTADEVSLISKTITLNGTYDPDDDNADGYSVVTVNVQNGASMSQTQGTYGTEVVITSASGAGPSATQHTIYFEFTDETNETIYVYYDDSLTGSAITATVPETYNNKTVTLAQLDGVTWYSYSPSAETWETIFNDQVSPNQDDPYPSWWFGSGTISDVYPTVGSVWRVTLDGATYDRLTAFTESASGVVMFGNTLYFNEVDNGVNVPFIFFNAGWGAWSGGASTDIDTEIWHTLKIERLVTGE